LLDFIDAHPDCTDLLQGPMLDDSLHRVATHWEPGGRAAPHVPDHAVDLRVARRRRSYSLW